MNDLKILICDQSYTLMMLFSGITLVAIVRGFYVCGFKGQNIYLKYYNKVITFFFIGAVILFLVVMHMDSNPTENYLEVKNVWRECYATIHEAIEEAK